MAHKKGCTVTAVFRNRFEATEAYNYVLSRGYSRDEVNVMMSDSTRELYANENEKEGKHPVGSMAAEGVATGGAIGTAVGATAAAIAAIGTSVLVPGLGIVVAGPILAALAGGGAGAVTGGLLGGLIGLGIPESNAKAYEAALKEGGVVIGACTHSTEDANDIRRRFEELHGENIVTV